MTTETLNVKVNADMSGFNRGMNAMQGKLNKIGGTMKNVGSKMTKFVTLPLLAVGAAAIKSAMDLEATEAKYNTVFAGMTDDVDEFIKEFKKLTPITKAAAKSMASGIQDLLVPMGFMREEATEMTGEFLHVIGALTNFNSGTHSAEDVTAAMQSALSGMYMPLRRLGIQLDKTTIQEKALEMGLVSHKDQITKQIEAEVMLAEVYAQSGDALNAYTEESLDAKTRMGLLKTEITDTAAEFGFILLPEIEKIIAKLRDLTEWIGSLTEEEKENIIQWGKFIAIAGPVLYVMGLILTTASKISIVLGGLSTAATTAGTSMSAAFGAALGPVLLLVAALTAITIMLAGLAQYGDEIAYAQQNRSGFSNVINGTATQNITSGGLGWQGILHGGIDSVPKTGTYLLEKGEQVLSKEENRSGGGEVVHSGTITVRGVNNEGELRAVIEQDIARSLAEDDRRLPRRASIIPI